MNQLNGNGILDLDAIGGALGRIRYRGSDYTIVAPPAWVYGQMLEVAGKFQALGDHVESDPAAFWAEIMDACVRIFGLVVPDLPEDDVRSMPYSQFERAVHHVMGQVFQYRADAALEGDAAPEGESANPTSGSESGTSSATRAAPAESGI